jgi:hypothetical protein
VFDVYRNRPQGGRQTAVPKKQDAKEAPPDMKKLLPVAVIAAAVIAVPAFAAKPASPGANGHAHSKNCKHSTLTKAYVFGGTLSGNPTLTQTAGQATPNNSGDDLFNVGLTLTVTNANRFAKNDHPTGSTFGTTLSNVAVSLGQNTDTTQRTPQNGDHVTIHGRRAFKVKRNCVANANAPVGGVTYKSVNFGNQPTP